MNIETLKECIPKCHYQIEHIGELDESVCTWYKTLCSVAMLKCDLLKPLRKENIVTPIKTASVWPGANRGWGPITRKFEGE
jgi:hypothetical protein